MKKKGYLPIFLIVVAAMLVFSGSGNVKNAFAQIQNPPTLSSQGENRPTQPSQQTSPKPVGDAPATDDYLPEGDLPTPVESPALPDQAFELDFGSSIASFPYGFRRDALQLEMGIQSPVLYSNGPFVTHPGGGYNGSDASAVQQTLGMNTLGIGAQYYNGYRLADDFTIPPGFDWQIDDITLYAYQTGSYGDPPTSPFTGLYLQIWDGSPDDPSSSVIFGDLVTNRLIDSYWTGIYRVLDYDLLDQTRPIMTVVANINIALSPGTYWLDWSIEGILTSGPWVPPITILGQTTTGTGLQHLSSGWGPAVDIATSAQQGLPFVIEGALSGLLWEQTLSNTNPTVVISHEFPDQQQYSSFLADDFVVDGTWEIDTIFFPGNGWNGFTSLLNATALHWEIYADDNGFPAGDPSGGGDPPIWSLTLPVTDLSIYISTGYDGLLSDTFLTLPTPVKLTSGHYWIVFYPTLNRYPYGQFGLHQADTTNGGLAKFINPGNGFGIGSSWQNWDVIFGVTNDDLAFTIGGISYYELFLPLTNK